MLNFRKVFLSRRDLLRLLRIILHQNGKFMLVVKNAAIILILVEKAVITVGAAQNLFLGEGTRQEYGLIRFEGEPFDVSESYMRLMMD